jgi:Protein of unknown function (DUF3489)
MMANTRSLSTVTKPRRRREPKDAQTSKPAASTATSKLEQIGAMLSRPEGASLAELVALTGWQAHSVRGALAGSLKRKGHVILSEKIAGERRYRIEAGR